MASTQWARKAHPLPESAGIAPDPIRSARFARTPETPLPSRKGGLRRPLAHAWQADAL